MFSILKVIGTSLWNWNVKEVTSVDTSSSAPEQKIVGKEQTWSFDGKVTKVNDLERYGLVDNCVFFSFDVVPEDTELSVGDPVCVEASRKLSSHAWTARSVSLLNENWDIAELDQTNCESSLPLESDSSISNEVKGSAAAVNGNVTSIHDAHGIMDNSIPISPKVILCQPSCKIEIPLNQGREVHASSVESKQGVCKQTTTMIPSPDQTESRKKMKPLVSDQGAIVVTKTLDFGKVFLCQKKCICAKLENVLLAPLNLLSYHFINARPSSEFFFGDVQIESNCKSENFSSVSQSEETVIPPDSTLTLNIHCKAQTVGPHEDRLVFEFDNFSVERIVKCCVVDPVQDILKPTAPFVRKSKEVRKMRSESLFFIPGEKPYVPKGRFSKSLPLCPVPRNLWNAVQSQYAVTEVASCLLEDLSLDNYVRKFRCLLHLEEIQAILDMREFSMSEVCLYKRGEFLSLEVPGLAEGRPSLLLGDKVILFHPDRSVEIAYEGYIHEVHKSEVLLKFNESFHAKYDCETFDVAFQFSRTTFRRCHHAVASVCNHNPAVIFPQLMRVKACLLKNLPIKNSNETLKSPVGKDLRWFNESLNDRQKEAVRRILQGQCRPTPYIIFGPPGTGKTITLIEAVLQTYVMFKNSKIVVCAPSNSAADLVVQRLLVNEVVGEDEVVRLNSYQRNVENIPEFIKPLCQDKNNIEVAIKYPIIVVTCTTAGAILMQGYSFGYFTHIFIDEAGQATEPESLLAVSLLSQNRGQVILSGDPCQLGPVLRSKFSTKYGLQTSYLERLMHSDQYQRDENLFRKYGGYNPLLVTMLVESYRSHPLIMEFPSKTFYFSELICSVPNERIGVLDSWKMLPKQDFPLLFHGVEGEELREENSPSWFNPAEVMQVVLYLQNLYENDLKPEQIGIITPYRKQVEKIKLLISAFRLELPKVGSVEEFQGQERTVIMISTVRSNNNLAEFDKIHNLGFLSNPKRTNVSITRAKDLLIVIGNPFVLQNDYYWKEFMMYIISHGGYVGCDLPSSLKECGDL